MKNLFCEESCCLLEIDLQYLSNCGKGYEILFTGRTCYHKLMQIEAARYNLLVSTSVYQAPILPLTFFIRDPLFFLLCSFCLQVSIFVRKNIQQNIHPWAVLTNFCKSKHCSEAFEFPCFVDFVTCISLPPRHFYSWPVS